MAEMRYDRQTQLPGFGEAGQARLAHARILVIGAGGLGCPALQYLAAAGIGHLTIVDPDTVAASNLHRQILYGEGDVGLAKVACADRALRKLNGQLSLALHPVTLDATLALRLIPGHDVVIDATDSLPARLLLDDACALFGVPLVYGAVSRFEGQLAVFARGPDGWISYRDLFPSARPAANCAESGVLGVLPGIIGLWQATEAIKLIAGFGEAMTGHVLTYDLRSQRSHRFAIARDPKLKRPTTPEEFLAAHGGSVEIEPAELARRRAQGPLLVIDIREAAELRDAPSWADRHLPLSSLPATLPAIPAQPVVLVCRSGRRSLQALSLLREAYGEAAELYSLRGGMLAWDAYHARLSA